MHVRPSILIYTGPIKMNVRALHDETLSFGTFEFQPHSGRLTKHGHRIKLQPKSAAILSCLLEQPGEVVSRGQLQKELWPEGHYIDFELGIKVAVKKLRDALGDESADPNISRRCTGRATGLSHP